jgi:uncharacterized membrane protein
MLLNVVLLWLLFAGTHVGLSITKLRSPLVAKLGEWGFVGVFSLVAISTYALLIHYFAIHRFDGPAGPNLAALPIVGWILYGISSLGTAILAMALFDYPVSPYALAGKHDEYEARGVARISRHGFFAGVCILSVAHALAATHLITTVFFGCAAAFTWIGAAHQDARMAADRGETHGRFLATTSFLPFAAIVAGRQRLVLSEIPAAAFVSAVVLVWLMATVHDSIFAAEGAYAIGITVLGASVASLQAWRG